VGVLDKAIVILEALADEPRALADLVEVTELPRATTHRLAVALERHRFVDRDGDGRFVLGPRLIQLARAAGVGRRTLADVARPALTMLRDATGESAQLFVADGDTRVCVVSLESPHSLRTIVPVGASLPMELGSAGHALRPTPEILKRGWVQSVEEREKGVASVSAPVVHDGKVVAAVSVSGPIDRTTRQPGRRYATAVVEAAQAVVRALG
jgi:DNA-binding IclR family transcriptional regulator